MADVYYSMDGGSTWRLTTHGDRWPASSDSGEHIVRRRTREAPYGTRMIVKVESTDADNWGIRSITVKGEPRAQEESLG